MKLLFTQATRLFIIALLLNFSSISYAQESANSYPSRTVNIISPFAPGGATDILARILAQKLGEA